MPVLSMIVPTYNESESLPLLVERAAEALVAAGVDYEIVVVDDNSPDGTGAVADELAERYPVRVLHRTGKGGLASAVIAGIPVAAGGLVGVMDADLSHPPELIPAMLKALEAPGVDLVIGSRYVPGGGTQDWPLRRYITSVLANRLTIGLVSVKDATSRFFIVRREALDGVRLNPIGFKIGLEVIARAHYRDFIEVPYIFTDRKHGGSKFGRREVVEFLKQLAILHAARLRGRPR